MGGGEEDETGISTTPRFEDCVRDESLGFVTFLLAEAAATETTSLKDETAASISH